MTDFVRPIRDLNIRKVKDVPRDKAIRVYPEFTGGTNHAEWRWNLQIRGPEQLANFQEGSAFIVAAASCSADDLRALRAAIAEQLAAEGEPID